MNVLFAAAELIHDTRDITYTYKGETAVTPAVTGEFCPACVESILDASESNAHLFKHVSAANGGKKCELR